MTEAQVPFESGTIEIETLSTGQVRLVARGNPFIAAMAPRFKQWLLQNANRDGGLQGVIISQPPIAHLDHSPLDLVFFDAGYVRVVAGQEASHTESKNNDSNSNGSSTIGTPPQQLEESHYLRSDLVTDLAQLAPPSSKNRVAFSNLGQLGRFANQLFQYLFIRLYGLRLNALVDIPPWVGDILYHKRENLESETPPISGGLQLIDFPYFVGAEAGLWYDQNPGVNVDFSGFYQVIPDAYRTHKQLIRLLLRPNDTMVKPINDWLAREFASDETKIVIHIRRGDYVGHSIAVPEFQLIPIAWYLDAVDKIWHEQKKPRLIIATDAPELITEFAEYAPVLVPGPLLALPEWDFFPDFHTLSSGDIIFVINSSFSRMASLLASDLAQCYIPDIAMKKFIPYSPWEDMYFWDRFEQFAEQTNGAMNPCLRK